MLRAMDIRDMLLIDRLSLEFAPGLNVLTGETGAGKSILLDCLGFVLGWRGRAELVRAGAAQGQGVVVGVVAVRIGVAGHGDRARAAVEALHDAGITAVETVGRQQARRFDAAARLTPEQRAEAQTALARVAGLEVVHHVGVPAVAHVQVGHRP